MNRNIFNIIAGVIGKLVVVTILTTYYLPLTTYGSYEDNSGGARMRGLGGAFVSIADDSETVFIQPAGTLNIKQPQLSATYGKLFVGLSDGSEIADSSFALIYPVDEKLGIGIAYKSTGLKQAYTEQSVLFNMSMGVYNKVSMGLNIKYLTLKYGSDGYTRLDPVFLSGYDKIASEADAGILASPVDRLTVGYSVRNLARGDLGLRSREPASLQEIFGVSYHEQSYLMAFEAARTNGKYKYIGALEKGFFAELFKFRCGFGWGDGRYRKISAGFGFKLEQFFIDYAWDYPLSGIEQTSGTHYITFTAKLSRFGGKKQAAQKMKPVERVKIKPVSVVEPKEAAAKTEPIKPKEEMQTPLSPVMLPGMLTPLRPPVSLFVSTDTLSPAGVETAVSTAAPVTAARAVSTETVKTEGYVAISTKPAVIYRSETPEAKPAPESQIARASIIPGVGVIIKPIPKKPAVKPEFVKIENKSKYTRPAFTPGTRTYKVKNNDTMMTLADRYYGKKSQWTVIYEANKDNIEKGALKPGQMIIIP